MVFELLVDNSFLVHCYHRRSFLVAEDDLLLKPFLARILYDVDPRANLTWVTDEKDGRMEFLKNDFDLVISDFRLSKGGSGVSLLSDLKKLRPDVPLMMISAADPEKIRQEAAKRDLTVPFLKKPFGIQECRAIVKELLI